MAEDKNSSDFDELLGMYSEETTEGDSSSDSSGDFNDLLSIYSEEDVKKKEPTSESPSQDGESVSTEIETQEKPSTLNPALLKNSGIYNYINTELKTSCS